MRYTILGATGFVGSHLAEALRRDGHDCVTPGRGDPIPAGPLGHVIYCIGLTADWRGRPHDTVEAHVEVLGRWLRHRQFSSLVYLSSTRVYRGAATTTEGQMLVANPAEPDDLYNLSKMMGESLCLSSSEATVRAVRLSNVYGPDFTSDNFLSSIVRDALRDGKVTLRSAPDSEKDYISLHDVVALLPRIATSGRERLYNLGSGFNTTNQQILARLSELTGCRVEYAPNSPRLTFPPIDTRRIREEFGFQPRSVVDDLDEVVAAFQAHSASIPRTP